MNLIQKIAVNVEARIDSRIANGTLPAKGKRVEDANFELWMGAYLGIVAASDVSDDADWLGRVITLLIGTRGLSETRKIAQEGRYFETLVSAGATPEAAETASRISVWGVSSMSATQKEA